MSLTEQSIRADEAATFLEEVETSFRASTSEQDFGQRVARLLNDLQYKRTKRSKVKEQPR